MYDFYEAYQRAMMARCAYCLQGYLTGRIHENGIPKCKECKREWKGIVPRKGYILATEGEYL